MAIPSKNMLGNPNVTEGNFQIAIEQLRESVIGSGKTYDSANTYMAYDICYYNGVVYCSKINSNIGNTPSIGANWGDYADLLSGVVHKTGDETIAGVKTFSSSPIVPVPTLANQAISMGNIIEKTGVGIGYDTGSGGSVIQLTSKSTAVSLNKPSGLIVTAGDYIPANTVVSFLVNNTTFGIKDLVVVTLKSDNMGSTSNYLVWAQEYSTGQFIIHVWNRTAGALAHALVINFAIIKGATS